MDSAKLPITRPCPIDLDSIDFDRTAKQSYCSHCQKDVHNLSTMTEDEASSFLRKHAGRRVCVTYARATDGRIRFQSPAAPFVPAHRLTHPLAAAGFAAALAACTPHAPIEDGEVVVEQDTAVEDPSVDAMEDLRAGGIAVGPPDEFIDGGIEPTPVEDAPCDPEDTMLEGEIAPEDLIPRPSVRGRVAVPPSTRQDRGAPATDERAGDSPGAAIRDTRFAKP